MNPELIRALTGAAALIIVGVSAEELPPQRSGDLFVNLQRDLQNPIVKKLKITARSYSNITFQPQEEDDFETNYRYKCDYKYDERMQYLFEKDAPRYVRPADMKPDLFWKIEMQEKNGAVFAQYYFGRTYSNSRESYMVYKNNAYNVDSEFVEMLEKKLNMQQCSVYESLD